ncbi:MAG: serine/threonine protein kinase [Opitutales bacterium]|nr:serine/threonine protein kinase [Opitutales bacterium]
MTGFLAEGGMGIVYAAEQIGAQDFRKRVALKIIRDEYARLKAFRANFLGEARLVADLIHNNIVQIYHFGEHDGRYFMSMELVEGYTLGEFLRQHEALRLQVPVDLAVFLVSRVCRGLSYAHHKSGPDGGPLNIVHRDINPRNTLLGFEGEVKITDFGIAKARDIMYNEEGKVIAGKDDYLSPEQARMEVTDARSDLFAAGIMLAELLCGENPFAAPTPEETRENITRRPLPDPREYRQGIDHDLFRIVRTALDRDRSRRFQSAGEMLRRLEYYLYSDHYGPTTEKLAQYVRRLFANGPAFPREIPRDVRSLVPGHRETTK